MVEIIEMLDDEGPDDVGVGVGGGNDMPTPYTISPKEAERLPSGLPQNLRRSESLPPASSDDGTVDCNADGSSEDDEGESSGTDDSDPSTSSSGSDDEDNSIGDVEHEDNDEDEDEDEDDDDDGGGGGGGGGTVARAKGDTTGETSGGAAALAPITGGDDIRNGAWAAKSPTLHQDDDDNDDDDAFAEAFWSDDDPGGATEVEADDCRPRSGGGCGGDDRGGGEDPVAAAEREAPPGRGSGGQGAIISSSPVPPRGDRSKEEGGEDEYEDVEGLITPKRVIEGEGGGVSLTPRIGEDRRVGRSGGASSSARAVASPPAREVSGSGAARPRGFSVYDVPADDEIIEIEDDDDDPAEADDDSSAGLSRKLWGSTTGTVGLKRSGQLRAGMLDDPKAVENVEANMSDRTRVAPKNPYQNLRRPIAVQESADGAASVASEAKTAILGVEVVGSDNARPRERPPPPQS